MITETSLKGDDCAVKAPHSAGCSSHLSAPQSQRGNVSRKDGLHFFSAFGCPRANTGMIFGANSCNQLDLSVNGGAWSVGTLLVLKVTTCPSYQQHGPFLTLARERLFLQKAPLSTTILDLEQIRNVCS